MRKFLFSLGLVLLMAGPSICEEPISDGVHRQDYTNGAWEVTTYRNGKKNGASTVYWKSGAMQKESNYIDDLQEGPSRQYFENGTLALEENYKNGKREGLFKVFDQNGAVIQQSVYKEGLLMGDDGAPANGARKEYTSDGGWQENEYRDGKLHGLSKVYDKTGKLLFEKRFANGRAIGTRIFFQEAASSQEETKDRK